MVLLQATRFNALFRTFSSIREREIAAGVQGI